MSTAVILLAAGQGSRMQSDLPKVLHDIAGAPMLHHALTSANSLDPAQMVVVTGHGADAVEKAALDWSDTLKFARQETQLGTGHAVDMARDALQGFEGDAFVMYGDTPFISPETLTRMQNARAAGAAVVVLGFEAANPGRYGRLVVIDGNFEAIIEAKDATPEQLEITLCNSGVICADAKLLFDLISKVGNQNASGEYYLTDVVGLARAEGHKCDVVACSEAETQGVNTRLDLAAAEAAFQTKRRTELMIDGVTMTAPETVFLAMDTEIGRDVVIEPNVVFGPGVTVETGAHIRAFSHLEGCHVSEGAIIGPYARLRPGAEIGGGARVGNFVEIKNAVLEQGAKANHLTYVGDAHIGKNANLGAGTITCNYDGVMKHRTEIGEEAFIGSNSALVAPVKIGDRALIGSGSVITSDVPDNALAVGRGRQETKPGLGLRLMDRLRAIKATKKG